MRAALVAVAASAIGASSASAKSFDVAYDWADVRYGTQGWRPDNTPPGGVAGGPWYAATTTAGQGLRIAPTGAGGAPYKDARGTWAWDVPAGASIRRVRLEGVSGTATKRQYGRVWSIVSDEPADDRSGQQELTYSTAGGGAPSASWTIRNFTFLTPAGKQGLGFVLWLYTIPCETAGAPAACVNVAPSDGAQMRLRKATFTVDDPSKPTLTVDGLPDGTAWTRERRVTLRATAADGQSGVARTEAVVRGGGTQRTVRLGRWTPDRFHVAARTPGTPALGTSRESVKTVTVGREGATRISVSTVNGAGMKTTQAGRVRVDRERPSVTVPAKLKASGTVRVADRPSGVREAVLTVDGQERDRCEDMRSCRLRVPAGIADRSRVGVRVVDRAGNERRATRTVRVPGVGGDRRRPKIVWPKSVKAGAGVTITDDRSGVADAALTVAGTDDVLTRCGTGSRRCRLRVPTSAAGRKVQVVALDRARNRASSTRRVAKRPCRPKASCEKKQAAKSSFLVYPEREADLWAGPLRFRWSRPSVKGVKAGDKLWYRVSLDGEEIYAGEGFAVDEYGVEIAPHRWKVAAYRNRNSRRALKSETRRFRMVEYGGGGWGADGYGG